ncbi:hypothetical protein, conserved [Eimeria acervulina]|uniref:Uncharacterized protein n=1 Tax=Eimeria acervulina TaxID=5801 RepID=U6GPT2_EIMAC|nr:hypothetical protein, conserved [Eimeria acervulina]CDI82231.1 hypothetical protein, conserved [Eimeria acervulina]
MQDTNLLPNVHLSRTGQPADFRLTHRLLGGCSGKACGNGSTASIQPADEYYREENMYRNPSPAQQARSRVGAATQTVKCSCSSHYKCPSRGQAHEQEQKQLLGQTAGFNSLNERSSCLHEAHGGIVAAPCAASSHPERDACEAAVGRSLSEASAAEKFQEKLNCEGDEDARPAAAEPSAFRSASQCASLSTNVDSETAESIFRDSHLNSSFVGGPPPRSREWGGLPTHNGLYRRACVEMHKASTSSAKQTDSKDECAEAAQTGRAALDAPLRQTFEASSLGASWDASQLGSAAASVASTGEPCSVCCSSSSLRASANLRDRNRRQPPDGSRPCATELNPSWEECERCSASQCDAEEGHPLERSALGGLEGPEAALREAPPEECATWGQQLCDCLPPYKDCGNAREHSEQTTVSTALASSSTQLPSASSPVPDRRPSCSCSPISDACSSGVSACAGMPGRPSSDASVQLSVSEESRCATPQLAPPINRSINGSQGQPEETRACIAGLHRRKIRLLKTSGGDSHSSSALNFMMDFGALGFLPSMPVLNIAARIIQRHWRRARYRLRAPTIAGELQKASTVTDEQVRQQHTGRPPLATWETSSYASTSHGRAGPPTIQQHQQGKPTAPGREAPPETDACTDASMKHLRTRGGTAFEGCLAAYPAAGKILRGGEQPTFISEGPPKQCCLQKETLNLCGRERSAEPHRPSSSSCPRDGEAEPADTREHVATAHAAAQDFFLETDEENNATSEGLPPEGSVSSDAEFAALLREAEVHDRMQEMMSLWPERCASSFPGTPKMRLYESLNPTSAQVSAGGPPVVAAAKASNEAVSPSPAARTSKERGPLWMHATFLSSPEVVSMRGPGVFKAEGCGSPSPEAIQPIFLQQTQTSHQPPSPCLIPQQQTSERCPVALQAAEAKLQGGTNGVTPASISSNNTDASCAAAAAAAQQHAASNSRGTHTTTVESCANNKTLHEHRSTRSRCRSNHLGRPPIPPKDLIAAAEQMALQQRLAQNAQEFRKQLLLQMQQNELHPI